MRRYLPLLLLSLSVIARAETPRGMDAFFTGAVSGEGDTVDVTPGRSGVPRILSEDYRGNAVVSKSEKDTWSVSGRFGIFDMSDAVVIPTLNLAPPTTLYNVQAGGAYVHQIEERRGWGVRLGVGSASDRLFYTIHETEFSGTVHYEIPSRDHNAWIFLAQYSNNRTFLNNVPIPGFAYLWNAPEQHFRAILGFPFLTMSYDPSAWSFRASLFGPTNQHLEVARRIWGPLKLYVAYDHSPLSWLRTNRDNYANRLIFNQQRGLGGLHADLSRTWSLDLSGGYAFKRQFYESKDANRSDVPKANIPAAPFVSGTVSVRL